MAPATAVTPDRFATFGELLRYLRRRAGLTQRELSIAAGYSESQISRLEKNERAPDEAALTARFVPALDLATEPEWVNRLLALAAATHARPESMEPPQPAPAAPPAPNNLPLQLTSFIGREKELEAVTRLLAPPGPEAAEQLREIRPRLVTLTGHGGCGKTRLALQAATGLVPVFPDGVWLVELAPLADPALVPQTVAAVLGLKEEPDRPILATLTHHLRHKTTLLLLDNCEHLVQISAQLAEAVLHACPDVRLLATSREMLGLAGERAVYVPSLSMPDAGQTPAAGQLAQFEAVRLFVDRAEMVAPGFSLTPDNAPAVAQICQRLDGIPLALELAAARVKVLRVEQIAARLTDSFRLLTGGSRTALPRQQTLQAAIDWSYDLLPVAEQQLFNRLAVFAGGWTLEAAEAVCAGEGLDAPDVLDLLTQLVNKSLVLAERAPQADSRYRLLETVRQYALARLAASGEADSVRRRHAEYYVALAETDGPRATNTVWPAWLDRMELELGNLRAALAWSLSGTGPGELGLRLTGLLPQFWVWRGYWDEFRRWVAAALAFSDAAGAPLTLARAWALLSQAEVGSAFGQDYATLQAGMAESLALFEALGERSSAAWALHQMGWRAREHGDADTARARLEESVAIYRELGDQPRLKGALISLGGVLVMAADTASAVPVIEEGLALARQAEDVLMIGWALNHLGHVAQLQGAYERAQRLHEESLAPFEKIGSRHEGTIWAHHGLGETALARGNGTLATAHFTKALALCQELGDRAGTAWCLAGLAGAAAVAEEPERAAWLWGAAEALRLSQQAREAPAARATHERLKASVRDQLGQAAFDAAWAAGQAAATEQAIDLALGSAAERPAGGG